MQKPKSIFILLSLFMLMAASVQAVPFVLHNKGIKALPLKIPGVMKTRLAPMSKSKVDLKVGQKIFFMVGKKKHLLLKVTEELRDQELDVRALIKQRIQELGLK